MEVACGEGVQSGELPLQDAVGVMYLYWEVRIPHTRLVHGHRQVVNCRRIQHQDRDLGWELSECVRAALHVCLQLCYQRNGLMWYSGMIVTQSSLSLNVYP